MELPILSPGLGPVDSGIEEWRAVPDWEGFYEISTFGRIRSLARRVSRGNHTRLVRARMMSICHDSDGYAIIVLQRDGIAFQKKVHRLVWQAFVGPVHLLDHKDRNRSNNMLANLRPATISQNGMNSKLRSNSSGIKGVCWDSTRTKWRASIKLHGRQRHLGYFDMIEDAAAAYAAAAVKYFGEFACPG